MGLTEKFLWTHNFNFQMVLLLVLKVRLLSKRATIVFGMGGHDIWRKYLSSIFVTPPLLHDQNVMTPPPLKEQTW